NHRGHGADRGQNVRHEAIVPGHVDEGQPLARGQGQPGESQVDRQAPAPLGLPPVRLHSGQRADQGGFPVIDVAGGGDDLHRYPAGAGKCSLGETAAAAITAAASVSSPSGGTERRSSSTRPPSVRPITAGTAPRRTGSPARSGTVSDPGRLTAALGSATPGAAPPPAPAWAGTGRASSPAEHSCAASRSARSIRAVSLAASASATGAVGPASVASRAANVSLSTRSARASGCRASRVTRSARPRMGPAWGPPTSLSPLALTTAAPARSQVSASGSPGSCGHGTSRPEPMSPITGTARPASSATLALAVNP